MFVIAWLQCGCFVVITGLDWCWFCVCVECLCYFGLEFVWGYWFASDFVVCLVVG